MGETPYDEFGRFHLLERIGAGGMGEVFRAEMRGPDGFSRTVVVKRMLPELAAEADAVAMFVDEARLAARLIHPNIVQVHDFGKVGARYFLVMEYVAGCDLSRLLGYLADQKRNLPVATSITVVAALLEGLAFAHELRGADGAPLGLVHRDVTPSNVLLGTSGEIKLTDFGIAKTRERLEHTRIGVIKGKQHYMSPEQASGRPLDARSDLFAAGVILFRLLTGHRPFRGDAGGELLDNIRHGRHASPESLNPELGPGLCAVLARALQTDAGARFQTAREFRQALLAEGMAPDTERLAALVAEAAAAFAPHDTVPTQPARPTGREPTEAIPVSPIEATVAAAPAFGSDATAPQRTATAPAGTSHTTPTTVVIQARHVVLGAIAVIALLAVAVVVAVRLMSSHATAPPHARKLRVAIRMYPAQAHWFVDHVFEPFAKSHDVKVEVVEFNSTEELTRMLANGEADMAKVDIEHAPLLVELGRLQRIPAIAEHVDPDGFAQLRKALRPEAIQLGTFHTTTGDDMYLLPRKLETSVLVYRPSLVRLAVKELDNQRKALDDRLRGLLGHGLPEGFTLNPDPAKWTSWDLVAAAWVWAHTPIKGETRPRYALRAEKRVLMEAVGAGAPAHDPWHVSPALVDLFFEYAVLRELDVLHPDTYQSIDFSKARDMVGTQELAAFILVQIDVGILAGNGHGLGTRIDDAADLDVAPLPRLCDLQRSDATPVAPEPLAEVWGWGWGVPRTSREPELALQLIMDILSRDRHGAELEEFPILRVRDDVAPRWPLSRRLNEVGDEQLGHGRARFVDWPKRAGEMEQMELRIERAFRDIVIDQHYRGPAQAIDRAVIESRLHSILDGD